MNDKRVHVKGTPADPFEMPQSVLDLTQISFKMQKQLHIHQMLNKMSNTSRSILSQTTAVSFSFHTHYKVSMTG